MEEESSNLSAMLHGLEDIKIEEGPIPEPGPGEVQFAVAAVGICGTDVGIWKTGRFCRSIKTEPMALGHESSAVITKLGEGVNTLNVGDRVAVEPLRHCRRCEFCKSGRPYLCENLQVLGLPQKSGNMCRYNVHQADFCFKLPDHVSLEEGALVEPLAVAVWACKRGNVSVGDKVLVTGAGPIGLASLMTARAMGAAEICVANTSKPRLEIAKKMGADHVIHIDTDDAQDLSDKIVHMMGGMPDVTVECSGAELAIRIGLYATKSGKTIVLCGIPSEDVKVPLAESVVREVNLIGCLCYPNCYPTALNLIASGRVNMKQIITHRFPLEKTREALECVKHRKGNVLKAIINCSKHN